MSDNQVFTVVDPEASDIAYCCVLGMAGEVFGLVAYLGGRGLHLHKRILAGEFGSHSPLMLVEQNNFLVDFTNRDMLEKEDYKVIRDLDLRFRGRTAWPVFRSCRPNCAPWFLEPGEVRFLSVILEQSLDVCERVRDQPDLLAPPRNNSYFGRVPTSSGWRDAWIEPEPYVEPAVPELRVDEIRLFRVREQAEHRMKEWQVDLLVFPGAIMDRDRPYFSRLFLCVDPESGIVLSTDMMDPWTQEETLFDALLDGMETHSVLPMRVMTRSEALRTQLAEPLERMGITVGVASSLPALEEAEEGIFKMMSGGMPEDW